MSLREELDRHATWLENNNDTEFFISDIDEIEIICQKHIKKAEIKLVQSIRDRFELDGWEYKWLNEMIMELNNA